MSEKSYNIARGKFEKDIETVLRRVDPIGRRQLSSDMLGSFMQIVGIYKILYSSKYGSHARPAEGAKIRCTDGCRHSKSFLERLKKENEFHANFWRMLNVLNCGYIHSEMLKETLLTLYESTYVPVSTLASQIASIISPEM